MSEPLDYYLQAWELAEPQLLATTATSYVYTVTAQNTRVVLKLLTDIGEEERIGSIALRYYDGHGAIRLLRADDRAQLLEYVDGDDLTGMVNNGGDEQATIIIADVINRLHSVQKPFPDGLYTLQRWFRELFTKAQQDQHQGIASIFTRAAPVAEAVLADPQQVRVLHGDIHHENIRYHAERGWLVFDPKGLIGERTYDAANTFYNPTPEIAEREARLLKTAAILSEKLDINFTRLLTFVFIYGCLSASWSLSVGEDVSQTLKVAAMAESIIRHQ